MNFEDEYRIRLQKIIAVDSRYRAGAYDFVRSAVAYTTKKLHHEQQKKERRHISGQQLLDGIAELALQQFGPLTIDVLEEWGVRKTDDFGNIVFNLVNNNLLGASDEDSPEDFNDGYDFAEIFIKPFVETRPVPEKLPTLDKF